MPVALVLWLGLQGSLKGDDPAHLEKRVENRYEVCQGVDADEVNASCFLFEQVYVHKKHTIVESNHQEGVEAPHRMMTLIVSDVQEISSRIEKVKTYFQVMHNAYQIIGTSLKASARTSINSQKAYQSIN